MLDPRPPQRRKKLNVLVLYSIEPIALEEAGEQTPRSRAERISHSARRRVAAGVCAEIARVLSNHGFNATSFNMEDDLVRLRSALAVERPDLIVNRVDEFEGELNEHAANVMALLALVDYPYTGSDAICLNTCQNRVRTYLLLDDAGVPVPMFAVIRDINSIPDTNGFTYPLIITQAFDDMYEWEGMENPLEDRADVEARAVALSRDYAMPLLIEEYIRGGRRVHAIVMGNRVLDVLPLIEHVRYEAETPAEEHTSAAGDVGRDEANPAESPEPTVPRKRADTRMQIEAEMFQLMDDSELELAQLDMVVADRVRAVARRAFHVLGCRDAAQIDFYIAEDGTPYVVNVRGIFNMSRQSPFGVAATNSARGYEQTLVDLATIACERHRIDPRGELIGPPPPSTSQKPNEVAPSAPAAPPETAPTETVSNRP